MLKVSVMFLASRKFINQRKLFHIDSIWKSPAQSPMTTKYQHPGDVLMSVDVNIKPSLSKKLLLQRGQSPVDATRQFATRYGLPAELEWRLYVLLMKQLEARGMIERETSPSRSRIASGR